MSVPPEKPKSERKEAVEESAVEKSSDLKTPFDASAECKKWLSDTFDDKEELMAVLQALKRPPKDTFELVRLILRLRSGKLVEVLAEAEEDIRRGSPLY